jgi:hypothetical protein
MFLIVEDNKNVNGQEIVEMLRRTKYLYASDNSLTLFYYLSVYLSHIVQNGLKPKSTSPYTFVVY